jgi:hypothetical protein
MDEHVVNRKRRPMGPLIAVGMAVAGIASIAGLGWMIIHAMDMVRSGRGLETYHTFRLVEFNWLGFLVFGACTILAILVGLALRLREHMLWRSLEKKYGVDKEQL